MPRKVRRRCYRCHEAVPARFRRCPRCECVVIVRGADLPRLVTPIYEAASLERELRAMKAEHLAAAAETRGAHELEEIAL